MKLPDLKKYFRPFFKIVPGGPADRTRSVGVLACLDKLAEEVDQRPTGLLYRHTFRFRTEAEGVDNYGGETLDKFDYSKLYTYARALVEFYRDDPSDLSSPTHAQELIAIPDPDPNAPDSGLGWRTSGGAAGNAGRIRLRFFKLSDPAATGALKYDPDQPFVAGQLCYYDAGDGRGTLFYTARQAIDSPVPAPVPGLSTDYWKPAADPGVPGGNGGAGAGTVKSVNGVGPDAVGNVLLASRDPYAIGDNGMVVGAVIAANHTWRKGDLITYADADKQAAAAPPAVSGQPANVLVGIADVAAGDTFDREDSSGSAWRYTYRRRNDGTLGWTRIGKTA